MKLIIIILSCIIFLSGCSPEAKDKEDYLARVNDEKLYLSDFRAGFSEKEWDDMSSNDKEAQLQQWVNLTALAQRCDEEELSELPQIKSRLLAAGKKIKANTYIARELNNIKITEEELLNYYQMNKCHYLKQIKEYKYQRIVISGEEKLKQVVRELKSGMKFKDAAKEYSEAEEGSTGGYMGFVSMGDVGTEIWNVLDSLEKYRWKSIKQGSKYYLVRWYEKREAELEKNYEEIKDELRAKLMKEKRQEQYNQLIEQITLDYDMEINYLFDGENTQ